MPAGVRPGVSQRSRTRRKVEATDQPVRGGQKMEVQLEAHALTAAAQTLQTTQDTWLSLETSEEQHGAAQKRRIIVNT